MKETKEVVSLFLSFIKGMDRSFEDGKITLGDFKNFPEVLPKILPAIEGMEDIPKEFENPTKEDIIELSNHIKKEFDLRDDNIEALVINILDMVFSLIIAFREFRKVKK